MKRLFVIANVTLVILLAFSFMAPAAADEGANRDECIARGEEAVKLIEDVGNEAAFMKILYNDDDRRFHWDNGYVFVIEDEKGTFLAHPAFPGLVGQDRFNTKDDDGKLVYQEIIRIAKTKGKGWITYNWRGEKRDCYVLKVPDENLIVVSLLRLGLQK